MQKIIQENIQMMKKIHFAQPSVQYADHQEHNRNISRLRKLVQLNSMRQSMISTVRNYFSGYDDGRAQSRGESKQGTMGQQQHVYLSLEEVLASQNMGKKRQSRRRLLND